MCSPGIGVEILPYNLLIGGACLNCRIFVLRQVWDLGLLLDTVEV